MTYSATRDREQLRYLEVDIASFIQRYQSRPPGIQRRTLFLFPGGMGSQLLRARTSYQTGGPQTQTFQYDPVWLTLGTFLGDSLNLKMHDVGGVYQDLGDRIIIPYGSVEFLGLTPYTRFIAWCELNDIDWFVFGWDWRRRLEDTVSFFLQQIPSAVQEYSGAPVRRCVAGLRSGWPQLRRHGRYSHAAPEPRDVVDHGTHDHGGLAILWL